MTTRPLDPEVTRAFADLLQALMASRPRELHVLNTTAALHDRIALVEHISGHFRTFMRVLLQDTQHNLACSYDVASEFCAGLEDETGDAVGALLKGVEDVVRAA